MCLKYIQDAEIIHPTFIEYQKKSEFILNTELHNGILLWKHILVSYQRSPNQQRRFTRPILNSEQSAHNTFSVLSELFTFWWKPPNYLIWTCCILQRRVWDYRGECKICSFCKKQRRQQLLLMFAKNKELQNVNFFTHNRTFFTLKKIM